jgi:hypothetical protein
MDTDPDTNMDTDMEICHSLNNSSIYRNESPQFTWDSDDHC